MKRYNMVISSLAWKMLDKNEQFLNRFNRYAANKIREEFTDTLREIKRNPFLFSFDESDSLPDRKYRRALFGKWYKVIFEVEDSTIYINAVVDCRMDPERIHRELEEEQ